MKPILSCLFVLLCCPFVACSCSDSVSHEPECVVDHISCGEKCNTTTPCQVGSFCGPTGICETQCSQNTACDNGGTCSPVTGLCTAASDSGLSGTGGTGGGVGGSGGSCPDTTVTASKINPVVILVVDQSSSMNQDFAGNTSRWDALRGFLLQAPDGLIADLQSQVQFGLAMYSARASENSGPADGECPLVTTVAPMRDNFDAIATVYNGAEPIDETPTGDSIDRIIADLDLNSRPDQDTEPVVLILATDGEPDTCEQANPQQGQAEAIAAVERAFDLGVRTFIISVGEDVSAQHQQDVANAGLGRGPGDPDAEFWTAGNDQSLRAALTEIVGAQLGCEIALNGRVQGDGCSGTVLLGGTPLVCGDPNGWSLIDPGHIRLAGTACDTLKTAANATLSVTFPCGVPVLF